MRISLVLFGLTMFSYSKLANADEVHRVFASTRLSLDSQTSGESWLNGGLGRFGFGNRSHELVGRAEGNLEYQYHPSAQLKFEFNIQGHSGTADNSARSLGLVEANARYRVDIDFNQSVSFTAGQFFLPISLENTKKFWDSPYTLSFSSLNSWIGEEFRPIGVDGAYRFNFDSGERLTLAATAFGGNDSMGALLAYRGWSYGRLRSSYGDVLALPDLTALSDSSPFSGQRDDGTKPFGRDLDGRLGFAVRSVFTSDRLALSATWVDNLGDTELHRGEYAWRTKFAVLGASWFASERLEVLSEASAGSSTMGAGPGVDIEFYSVYMMLSYVFGEYRLSVRHDAFGIEDKDRVDEDSHDLGRSQTLALMWAPESSPFSAGAEVLYLNSKRLKQVQSDSANRSEADRDSISAGIMLEYRF